MNQNLWCHQRGPGLNQKNLPKKNTCQEKARHGRHVDEKHWLDRERQPMPLGLDVCPRLVGLGNLRCLQTFHFSLQASGGMACLSLQPMIPNTICTQRLSISLSNNIHTFIMGLDLEEDVEKDFLHKLS